MHDMTDPRQTAGMVEARFGLEELFYSRTDLRGIIKAGNAVFQRVSGFGWDALLGAPHRIVRHPDTPKAVFSLLWRTIQRGEPVVAYVKNRTATGGYYWVLATVLPMADGYLSIRIKPTSPLFDSVRLEYAALVAQEQDEGLSAEDSAIRLAEQLKMLGFASYPSFMTHALLQEYGARDRTIKHEHGALLAEIEKVRTSLSAIGEEQELLLHEFDRLRDLPTNLRIIASRLEPSGGPVSAISENYKITSAELSNAINTFSMGDVSPSKRMAAIFQQAIVRILCAKLQSEALQNFDNAKMMEVRLDRATEERVLTELSRACDANAYACLSQTEEVAQALNSGYSNIRRAILGLDSIRVMGRVESGRLGTAGAHLSATIDQLDVRHSTIIKRLETIMDLSTAIVAGVRRISVLCQPDSVRWAMASG